MGRIWIVSGMVRLLWGHCIARGLSRLVWITNSGELAHRLNLDTRWHITLHLVSIAALNPVRINLTLVVSGSIWDTCQVFASGFEAKISILHVVFRQITIRG